MPKRCRLQGSGVKANMVLLRLHSLEEIQYKVTSLIPVIEYREWGFMTEMIGGMGFMIYNVLHRFFKTKARKEYVYGASAYLKKKYESPSIGLSYSLKSTYKPQAVSQVMENARLKGVSLKDRDFEPLINPTFVDYLCEYIKQKNMKDPQVYKAANLDRRLFSKIMSDNKYQPAKDTAIALAFALHLNIEEVNTLLSSAGHTLSHSIERDIIIEYFFRSEIYNLWDIK